MALQEDAEIIQELAKQYCELAALEVNQERHSRLRAVNDLKTGVRPGAWIDELPWHELNFDGILTLHCEDDFARQMEQFFRRALFRWKYFQADMVLEGYYPLEKICTDNGDGLTVREAIKQTDAENRVVSHAYMDVLDTEEKLRKMHVTILMADPQRDRKKTSACPGAFGRFASGEPVWETALLFTLGHDFNLAGRGADFV